MKPKIEHISRFFVSGLTVRTINHDEFKEETAKIPNLWKAFFSSGIGEKILHRVPDGRFFGVYSDYESDATSFYNVTAGVPVTILDPGLGGIEIREGKYLAFEARGPMPTAVIQTWYSIWTYFENNPQVQRCFQTDFESYEGPENVQIYIGCF